MEIVGVMRMHDCLPIGTIPNHVHRYTLVYGNSLEFDGYCQNYCVYGTYLLMLRSRGLE
jgi:hypothetical protein